MRGPLFDRLSRELDERVSRGLLRKIPEPVPCAQSGAIDLATNSYLSLHTNSDVAKAAKELSVDTLHGNLASRLISETSPLAALLEAELASWKKTEAALLFNSGYAANVGILQALCSRDSEVFCDRLDHASIIDGILLSGCKLRRYRHNDMTDLKRLLAASKAKEKLIVTDTVFSMDGDCAPLADIVTLAENFRCYAMVDEAHATGVFGPTASGLVEAQGLADAIDIRMGTLSKAVAGVGGFFAGSTLVRDYLVNHARSLIYSTGLPHACFAFDLAAIRHIRAHPYEGRQLLEKANAFREKLKGIGFDTFSSTTQIIPCRIGEENTALALSAFLRERGIIAPAVRPPTVPKGGARIRFSLHTAFTIDQQETVIAALKEWNKRND